MAENEKKDFHETRSMLLKERMLKRIQKRPDDIIGTGHGEHYLGQTWCLLAKQGLCFLIDKRCNLQSDHFVQMTQILSQARTEGHIHPLFHPVPVREAPHRPYLVRKQIFGRTLDSTETADITLTRVLRKILSQQLLQLNILPRDTSQTTHEAASFDLRCENFIVQDIDTDAIFLKALELEGKSHEEHMHFLDSLHHAGGKVWIFDYGSWLRPDGKGKNQ